MTLLEAIQACAAFTHKLPGSIHGELRGRRVLEGIELDATDGANAIRVLVARDSLAPGYAFLPPQWVLTHAEACQLSDVGQLTIAKIESSDSANFDDCSSTVAKIGKIGKSGKPGKAKPGPVFRAFHDQSDQGRKWATFDRAITEAMHRVSPQAKVKRAGLVAALEPLDGSAEVIMTAHGRGLYLDVKPWSALLGSADVRVGPSLPIRLSVAPLWTALSSMEGDTVTLSWASLSEDSSATAATHREGGPLLVECGGVSFLTMPLREVGLIKAS
jgi:hypothetical protein